MLVSDLDRFPAWSAVSNSRSSSHPEDPASGTPHHELSLICDDITETVADLRARGIDVRGEPMDAGWGIAVTLALPGGLDVMLYEPRHATAI